MSQQPQRNRRVSVPTVKSIDPARFASRDRAAQGLRALLEHLRGVDYVFVTPTPATQRRVLGRPDKAQGRDLRDAFGWSLPFGSEVLPVELLQDLQAAGVVIACGDAWRATVRVASLGRDLFLHSPFPPSDEDAVFFGPDTYRFARFLESASDGRDIDLAVEIGVGSGAGASVIAKHFHPRKLIATDINPAALQLAAVNLEAAGVEADLRLTDGLGDVRGPADLIVANPPFIAGDGQRTYRDGGDLHGARLSLDWTLDGARRLSPGGRVLLYTGSAIVAGRDGLRDRLISQLDPRAFVLDYQELDPDIFGGQLGSKAYQDVERIAAVGVVVTRRP